MILIDVHYLQKAVFSFEKGLNGQNHSSLGSLHPVKKFPPVKFAIPPPLGINLPLTLRKILGEEPYMEGLGILLGGGGLDHLLETMLYYLTLKSLYFPNNLKDIKLQNLFPINSKKT